MAGPSRKHGSATLGFCAPTLWSLQLLQKLGRASLTMLLECGAISAHCNLRLPREGFLPPASAFWQFS